MLHPSARGLDGHGPAPGWTTLTYTGGLHEGTLTALEPRVAVEQNRQWRPLTASHNRSTTPLGSEASWVAGRGLRGAAAGTPLCHVSSGRNVI
jgi:hypothetical protein